VAGDDFPAGGGRTVPRGALVRYREWYGKGEKLFAEEVGKGIAELEARDPKLTYGVLDPSTFKEEGGPSIAERINSELYAKKLAGFHAADNARVATIGTHDRRGAMGGWDQMRARLVGLDCVPMIYCFSTCEASIRTIPVLQHDPMRTEDLDTKSEDHAADDWRYACMSRPWIKAKSEEEKKENFSGYKRIDLDDLRAEWRTY
jgi:hypothetical protein